MSKPAEHRDKAEDENQQDIKKTKEYRNFRKLLKQVVKAPPLRKRKEPPNEQQIEEEITT